MRLRTRVARLLLGKWQPCVIYLPTGRHFIFGTRRCALENVEIYGDAQARFHWHERGS